MTEREEISNYMNINILPLKPFMPCFPQPGDSNPAVTSANTFTTVLFVLRIHCSVNGVFYSSAENLFRRWVHGSDFYVLILELVCHLQIRFVI